ncbi:MAG: hypothetical protein WC934_12125, partial [Acidithiobacillus sp.]|uniref:hypothetical protein n=1 Tax=Acidithiobacillus sp. TaxID=1872118 RepID=UPI00355E34BA
HLCRSYEEVLSHYEYYIKDVIIAASLIHDMAIPICANENFSMHPEIVEEITHDLSNLEYYQKVINAAKLHEGPWSKNIKEWNNRTKIQEIVHLADYIASRRDIIVEI